LRATLEQRRYFYWLFLNVAVPGLPDPMSDEGCALWGRNDPANAGARGLTPDAPSTASRMIVTERPISG
jgi:hypothetical protein